MLLTGAAQAGDVAAFDLIGPKIEMTVTRNGVTLPIAQVPNLRGGDRLWIHPVLPNDQTARYLMVVAFLRGATNPPPESWFTRAETWNKNMREEGTVITVPAEAQQALIFLAPQTGGDFATLRSAVRGKPGAFVRAAQDLQLASLNRARLDKYLAAIRDSDEHDPKALHDRATLLARSLNIKVDESCFQRPVLQQASCLMQNSDQLVLDDGHGDSVVSTLTQGAGGDLIGAISTTRAAGSGAYSPYVGVVVDLARLMENLHTARYQYISALALPQGDELHLRLNFPPSFNKPQSVIVVGLPMVQPTVLPSLKAVTPETPICAQNPAMVLSADNAPLVFSSELAHQLTLHLENKEGKSVELPVVANALLGGFVLSGPLPTLEWLPLTFIGKVHGQWGFERFDGPSYKLERSDAAEKWSIAEDDKPTMVAGDNRTLHLHSTNIACIEQVRFRSAKSETKVAPWKPSGESIEVQLPLKQAPAGESAVLIKQYGIALPTELPLRVYDEVCRIDEFVLHAGDSEGTLKGSCPERVDSVSIAGTHWIREPQRDKGEVAGVRWSRPNESSSDKPASGAGAPALLHENQALKVDVTLKDGRLLSVPARVLAPRPRLSLVSKVIEPPQSPIHIESSDDLPVDGRLIFRLKSEQPATFGKDDKVEVASADGFFHAELTLEKGGLVRQNAHTILATLELGKDIAASAFGALRFRPVSGDGTAGDWQPLATLVRLPELTELRCPADKEVACTLSGSNLFLIDSIAAEQEFEHPTTVSESAMDMRIEVPHPKGKLLYLKLRDDPSTVQTLELQMKKEPAQASKEASAKETRDTHEDKHVHEDRSSAAKNSDETTR